MQSWEIILIALAIEHLVIIALFWKKIVHNFRPDLFYIVDIVQMAGHIKRYYYMNHKEKDGIIEINKKEYNIEPTNKTYNGSKYFKYNYGVPTQIETEINIDNNIDIELRQAEIRAENLFKEKKDILSAIAQFILPFIIGLAIGAMGMQIHMTNLANQVAVV